MFLQTLANNLRQQNWSVVFVELLVVVVGLVLAFQVDRWWEERGDRAREADYIDRLATEVIEDIESINVAIDLAETRQGFCHLLLKVAEDPAVADQQPGMFLAAVAQAAFTFSPSLITHTYDDLRSTGSMDLIRSEEIKNALYNYHSFDDAQQQFVQLNLGIELRYFELAADVLSADQYTWVQDQWFVVTKNDLEEVQEAEPEMENFPAAVERFLGDQDLINWVPRARGVQREQILMNEIRINLARDLLEALQAYSNTLEP
jgi:hypothetical protein